MQPTVQKDRSCQCEETDRSQQKTVPYSKDICRNSHQAGEKSAAGNTDTGQQHQNGHRMFFDLGYAEILNTGPQRTSEKSQQEKNGIKHQKI